MKKEDILRLHMEWNEEVKFITILKIQVIEQRKKKKKFRTSLAL